MDPETDRPKDRFRLDGRFALITGASKGLGFACARPIPFGAMTGSVRTGGVNRIFLLAGSRGLQFQLDGRHENPDVSGQTG
jgi:hypothetical protein